MAEYQEVLNLDPRHIKALFNLGNLHVQHGEYDQAISCFKWVLNLNDTNAEACNNLGSVYEGLERYDDAIEMYRKSITFKSVQEEAHCNLASLEYRMSDEHPTDAKLEAIVNRLQFVLSVNPRNANAQQILQRIENSNRAEVTLAQDSLDK